MRISITHHADGRSFRQTTEHDITLAEALAVYDPFWYRRTQAVSYRLYYREAQ